MEGPVEINVKRWSKMRMLFMGLGFLSYSTAYILGKKHEIMVTSRNLPPTHPVKRYYHNDLSYMGVKFAKVDPLNEPNKLRYLMKVSDVVVNFIGALSKNEEEMVNANYEVPKLLVNVLKDVNPNALFIHISASTLGQKTKDVEEESPHGAGLEPGNAFERSKLMGEKEVMKADIRKVILRPTLAYGIAGAHKHFVEGYRIAKTGIVPEINVKHSVINVRYLASIIDKLSEEMPRSDYFYVNECEKISIAKTFELYCKALNKKCIKVPLFRSAINLLRFVEPEAEFLLKYADYEFSCRRTKEFVGSPTFIEDDVIENAKFLRFLETQKELAPE
jgi:dTDP-4-dehydrorhamnose reductase